jgi:hypothetical protein
MKSHRFDAWSFVFGLVFAGLGALLLSTDFFFARPSIVFDTIAIGGPLLAILAGFALMAPAFRRKTVEPPGPTPEELAATEEFPASPL